MGSAPWCAEIAPVVTVPIPIAALALRDLADLPRAEELTIALQPHRATTEGDDDAAAYVEAES